MEWGPLSPQLLQLKLGRSHRWVPWGLPFGDAWWLRSSFGRGGKVEGVTLRSPIRGAPDLTLWEPHSYPEGAVADG